MRNHHLPVTYNRFEKENVYDSLCPLCSSRDLGDESHYLFKCKHFTEDRRKFIPMEILEECKSNYSLALKQILDISTDKLIDIARFVKIIMNFFQMLQKTATAKEET